MTPHATGMAHPRQTALTTMAQSLSESVVESMASAMSLDVHSDKTRRVSGAKAGADVYPVVRGRRGAVGAVAEPLAEFRRPLLAVMVPNAGGRAPWTAPL